MKFNSIANWKFKLFAFATMMLLSFAPIYAQTTTVKGIVSGDGEPLPGVTVLVKGTANGVVTDFDGNYEIKAKEGDKLLFSYVGFTTLELSVGKKNTINATLKSDIASLDEVVVIGYGTQTKKEVIGAVSRVEAEELSKISTSDIGTALQGQVSGVSVIASSGEPGAEANIQIRGLASVDGANTPLYVVDGIPFEGDPKLSTSEIESIDILKDAASAAIYGTRGAAGVILITTKKGKEGIMRVNLNSFYGVQKITSGTPILNKEDRLYTQFLRATALNGTVFGNTWTSVENSPHSLTRNSDLADLTVNDWAPIQNHSLSVSGGKEGLTYNINANFFSQEGIFIKSQFDRYNIRANTQYNKGKWKIRTGISLRAEEKETPPWGMLQDLITYNPLSLLIDPNNLRVDDAGDANETQRLSYLGYKLIQEDNSENQYFDASINAEYSITPDLKFTSRASASFDNGTRIIINPEFIAYNDLGEELIGQSSRIRNTSTLSKRRTWESILNYKKSIGDHNINATFVYSAEQYNYSQFLAEKYGIFNNAITVLDGATIEPNVDSGSRNRWTWERENTLIGTLGRFQYNYRGKYLFSASLRRDGSSRFKKEHYGWFPSYSLGWNVSDEDFWDPVKDVVNKFKLRASRGTTGNQGIADYSYDAVIELEKDYVLGTNEDLHIGAIQTGFANPNVKWETSVSTNFGYDLSLFRNKVTITGDYYVTNKKDMLFPVLLPPSSGGGLDPEVTLNVGDMRNTGTELAVKYKHSGKLSWNASLNYSQNKNTLTKLSGTNDIIYFDSSTISGHDNDQDLTTVLAEGYEAGAFFLMKTDGLTSKSDIYQLDTNGDIMLDNENNPIDGPYKTMVPSAQEGDLKYVDSNKDGAIDINDRTYAGSGVPDFELGLNFGAYYKGFDLSMQLYGAFGGEILNGNKALAYKSAAHQDLVYQWTQQNNTSTIPVNRGALHDNYRGHSDYWLEDGTFFRLRNLVVGYTIPKRNIESIGLSKLRVYMAGQNLLTLTKYKGYDPEVGGNGVSTRGIDKGNYPVTAQLRLGLQVQF
ncbi:SusC/RagA family TonB-linked outer membrane protein [Flavicella sediminum]|uniref:SusC/RagA family TonB-linked outer membrane protein n=1 Tax=Flavicella sediminum TaxID=2585141 RepID=UPI0011241485|nr:TonB-dependent receptor [Flavicella sediminum]